MITRKSFISLITLIFFCNFLVSCVTVGNKQITGNDTISQIKVGESTKPQVKAILGEPGQIIFTSTPGEEQWEYFYSHATPNLLFYLSLVFWWFMFFNTYDCETYTLTIHFTNDGIVKDVGKGKSTGRF